MDLWVSKLKLGTPMEPKIAQMKPKEFPEGAKRDPKMSPREA